MQIHKEPIYYKAKRNEDAEMLIEENYKMLLKANINYNGHKANKIII